MTSEDMAGGSRYGGGKAIITGNLLINERHDRARSAVRLEGGRDVMISGNKIVNAQIHKEASVGVGDRGGAVSPAVQRRRGTPSEPRRRLAMGGRAGALSARFTTWRLAIFLAGAAATGSMIRRSDFDSSAIVYGFCTNPTAPASVKRATVAVRSLHRYLAVEGVVDHDPGADVETPATPAGLPKALPEEDVARLLDGVNGDDPVARRDRAVLEVLYGTGLRIAELVGLSLADVDLDGALLRAFGKGSKERIVPVGRQAVTRIPTSGGA